MEKKRRHTKYKPTFFVIRLNRPKSTLIGIKVSKHVLWMSVFVSSGTGNIWRPAPVHGPLCGALF